MENQNPLQRYWILAIILGVTITLLGSFTMMLILYTWDKGEIAKGVVLEIPLGGLRLDEAQLKLEQTKEEFYARPVHFKAEEKDFSITLKELGLTYTFDTELQQAYMIGRKGSLLEKATSKFQASWGIIFKPQYQWNDQLLSETINKYFSPLNISAEDARFKITPDNKMEIVAEKHGKQVDIEALIASIKKLTPNQIETIPIPFKGVTPALTKTELESMKITALLSSYTTHFDPNQKGRTQNIKLAAQSIDGTLLKPGEEFSFNKTVGPRTSEAGYQIAIIIEGDEFVPGLGGGVCQVSSTLYNAVHLVPLTIIERSRHSLAVTYVPSGQDATVAYPNLDFKFRNDSGGYLLIRSIVLEDTVTFSLYGNQKS